MIDVDWPVLKDPGRGLDLNCCLSVDSWTSACGKFDTNHIRLIIQTFKH